MRGRDTSQKRRAPIDIKRPDLPGVATSAWIPAMNAGMTLGVFLNPA